MTSRNRQISANSRHQLPDVNCQLRLTIANGPAGSAGATGEVVIIRSIDLAAHLWLREPDRHRSDVVDKALLELPLELGAGPEQPGVPLPTILDPRQGVVQPPVQSRHISLLRGQFVVLVRIGSC